MWLPLCGILEKGALWRRHEDRGCQGLGGGRSERGSTGDLWGSETALHGPAMVGAHRCTFAQTCRTHHTRSDPQRELRTLGEDVSARGHRLSQTHRPVGVLMVGEAVHVWGRGHTGNLCTAPQFCCET